MVAAAKYSSEKIKALAEQIMYHKVRYYRGQPEISDAEFDALEVQLKQLAPNHPALQFVGSEISSGLPKAAHDRPMLSLAKTYDLEDLEAWQNGRAIVGMLKIDGNSLSLIYQNGKLQLAKTRGNGRIGEDVTDKARWIADILPSIGFLGRVEIRGELYCTELNFAKLSDEFVKLNLDKPTNPRNIVAGMLGRKTQFHLVHFFNFFAFDAAVVEGKVPYKTECEKFRWLGELGFTTPEPERLGDFAATKSFLAKVQKEAEESEFAIDGAVFSYDDLRLHEELGSTSHHPRYKMSFKWKGETAVVTIKEFLWTTSRLGNVTPVAVIEPVFLSGASITNITLHNAAYVKLFNLKAGDKIEIIRSGEVIPKFLQVVESRAGSYSWPKRCAVCKAELVFDGVRLKCPNRMGCSAQQQGTILNWIRSVEIEDLSDKRLEQMIEAGLVEDIADLYHLTKEDFLKLPLTKEKMAEKLWQNIQASKKLPLARFLMGLGIEGMGLASWEKLLEVLPGLEEIQAADEKTIAGVHTFAEKTAKQVVEGMRLRKGLIQKLLSIGVQPFGEMAAVEGGVLSGRQFVITGALSKPRSEVEKDIKRAGGKVTSSVSQNTFAVVTNEDDSSSSKMKKARQLNIKVIDEKALYKLLTSRG